MDIKKIRLPARESVYCININTDIGIPLNIAQHGLNLKPHNQTTNQYHMTYPGKLWETVDKGLFMLNNKTYLYIVDYHSKLLAVKLMDGLSADSLIKMWKIMYFHHMDSWEK